MIREPVETVEYKGYDINIYPDDPGNPFTDWDTNNCLMYKSGRDWGDDYSKGDIHYWIATKPTNNQLIYHQKAIIEMCNKSPNYGYRPYTIDEFNEDYPKVEWTKDERADIIRDEFIRQVTNYEQLEGLCELFKIPCYHATSRGYSQGDWADVFIAWTPEFSKVSGIKEKDFTYEHMESLFKLFTDWAWGDVYYYSIESDDEFIDSCGGFFGYNHEESGLLEYAKNAIDYHIKSKVKSHGDQVKQWIKSGVPEIYRKSLEV